MTISIDQALREAGVDIHEKQFVLFDDHGTFIAHTDTMDEAFAIADKNSIGRPAILDLDGLRERRDDWVF
jgi:hypothetical protein